MTYYYLAANNRPGRVLAEPAISAFDRGFTLGDGVYDTIRTIAGLPQLLDAHLDRLAESAAKMGMQHPGDEQVRGAVAAVLAVAQVMEHLEQQSIWTKVQMEQYIDTLGALHKTFQLRLVLVI